MKRLPIIIAVSALFVMVGCASTGTGPRMSPNTITAEELQEREWGTAYDVVQSLRPAWFRGDRAGGGAEAVVYLDGSRVGGPAFLRQIRANDVVRMEFLRASEASTRYGPGHAGGAILVTSGRR